MPFYILRQLPGVVTGFYLVPWETSAFVKNATITLAYLAATLVMCDIGVRRSERLNRSLFGMRPDKS